MKRILVVVTALTGMIVPVATAVGAPPGGQIRLIATAGSNPLGTIVVAGAIGDYGKTLSMTKSGKPDANGNYVKITLQKGTFEVDATAFNKAAAHASATISDTATCSYAYSASGPVTLFNGTGLYKGISATVTITINGIGYGPFFTSGAKKGTCNTSPNAQPLAQKGWIMGNGNVKFS